jgi:ammonium transporter, Amt family
MLLQSFFCTAVIGIQFWLYGFSLIMSHSSSKIIGNLDLALLRNTLGYPSQANSDIPDILLAAFHFTFVTCTAMILAGAMLERGRLFHSMLFLFCWTTFVYYFLAYWEWNPNGWLAEFGVYDFVFPSVAHPANIGWIRSCPYCFWIRSSSMVALARSQK